MLTQNRSRNSNMFSKLIQKIIILFCFFFNHSSYLVQKLALSEFKIYKKKMYFNVMFYDHRTGLKSNLYVIQDKLFQIFFILDGTAYDYFKAKGNSYRFTCVNCNQSYTAKASLKRHLKYTCPFNISKITFECPYCDHTTGRKDNLRTHMLTHTDSKSKKKNYLYA